MKIISWNVNGYRAQWKKGFEEKLQESNADIYCIQETKAWTEKLTKAQLQPLDYKALFSRPEKSGYSGVATFTRPEPVSVVEDFGEEQFNREGRVLITEYDKFTLANIYFPNGKSRAERLKYKMDFYEKTLEIFSGMTKQGKNVIVCGDYNTAHKPIDLARPKANEKISGFLPEEREWIDRWIAAGFVDIFREFNDKPEQYTWWDMRTRARDRNIGWRIDYHFVSERMKDAVTSAWIEAEVMGSDHCPLGIEFDLSKL
ncbi:exodeoxyribonuclease III [bacterium]|nr:exodeoxyribonuclease III [bacterium]